MKHLFALLALTLLMFTACEPQENSVSTITINSESPMTLGVAGGKVTIDYTITNPNPNYHVTAVFNSYWISNYEYGDNSITFTVERNTEKSDREGILKLNYGSSSASITIKQEGKTSDYDYDVNATAFGGEYQGVLGAGNFRYLVSVANEDISYVFDIFAGLSSRDNPILPNGFYTIDQNNSTDIGTISKVYSKAYVYDEDGAVATEFQMHTGSVTVSDNRFEAVVFMEDGTSHKIVYEGELKMQNTAYYNDNDTTLSSDFTFEHSDATMRLYYYGDKFKCGKSYWYVTMVPQINPVVEGDYFSIKVITDKLSNDASSLVGTYTPATDRELKAHSFIAGFMENDSILYSWYYMMHNDAADLSKRAPLTDGEVKIEADDRCIYVAIDCVDDLGNKLQGKYTCSVIEQYDRVGW